MKSDARPNWLAYTLGGVDCENRLNRCGATRPVFEMLGKGKWAMAVSSDAERLQSIQDLERAIASKQPELKAALARRDGDQSVVLGYESAIRATDQHIASINTEVHCRSGAVYVATDALDRGILTLGNEVLHFRGWHGNADISLDQVDGMTLGESNLSPRAGIPVLSRFSPGHPRMAGTLLIVLKNGNAAPMHQVVLADLADAAHWHAEIGAKKEHLLDVAARRAGHLAERAATKADVGAAATTLKASQADLDLVKREIGVFSAQRDALLSQQHQIDIARHQSAKATVAAAKKNDRR